MGDQKRSRQVLIRLTEEEYAALSGDAQGQGRELAQHVRWLALEGRKMLAAGAERHHRSQALTPADIEAVREIVREVTQETPPNKEAAILQVQNALESLADAVRKKEASATDDRTNNHKKK